MLMLDNKPRKNLNMGFNFKGSVGQKFVDSRKQAAAR
jgi:hypothetical protein